MIRIANDLGCVVEGKNETFILGVSNSLAGQFEENETLADAISWRIVGPVSSPLSVPVRAVYLDEDIVVFGKPEGSDFDKVRWSSFIPQYKPLKIAHASEGFLKVSVNGVGRKAYCDGKNLWLLNHGQKIAPGTPLIDENGNLVSLVKSPESFKSAVLDWQKRQKSFVRQDKEFNNPINPIIANLPQDVFDLFDIETAARGIECNAIRNERLASADGAAFFQKVGNVDIPDNFLDVDGPVRDFILKNWTQDKIILDQSYMEGFKSGMLNEHKEQQKVRQEQPKSKITKPKSKTISTKTLIN